MAQGKNTTGLTDLLLKCLSDLDPTLNKLEWLCKQLMEAEVSGIVGSEKNAHNPSRSGYRCGYRPWRLDTRMGTMYLSHHCFLVCINIANSLSETEAGDLLKLSVCVITVSQLSNSETLRKAREQTQKPTSGMTANRKFPQNNG